MKSEVCKSQIDIEPNSKAWNIKNLITDNTTKVLLRIKTEIIEERMFNFIYRYKIHNLVSVV